MNIDIKQLVIAILILLLLALALIWSLNVLFGAGITYGIQTVLAAAFFVIIAGRWIPITLKVW